MLREVVPDADGRVRPELRAGVAPPGDEERESWRRLPPGAEVIAGWALARSPRTPARSSTSAPGPLPSLDVNMIHVGEPRTIVPGRGHGHVTVRLAPGQERGGDGRRARAPAARPRRRRAPRSPIEHGAGRPVALRSRAARRSGSRPRALERACGARAGADAARRHDPDARELAERGIHTVATGFALDGDAIHAPNESYRLESLRLGEASARELYPALGGA